MSGSSDPRPLLVQFGAGAIGRSFIGQLFSRAGWRVIFVDVNPTMLAALNEQQRYRIVIKKHGAPDSEMWIEGVGALDARDVEAVAAQVAVADLAATSVGLKALPAVLPLIALGLEARVKAGAPPLDVILAENIHDAAHMARTRLRELLPVGFPLETSLGLVETSIGKMVPIMRAEDLREDPLQVFAEPYNELILAAGGFLNPLPDVPGLHPVKNIAAWVDRKLYIHNLGHAAAAYYSHLAAPQAELLADGLAAEGVREAAQAAMRQSAAALLRIYPDEFTPAALEEHIQDLLGRFANRALGDTVYRVGRDLQRKLAHADRIVGPMRLAAREGLPYGAIAAVWHAALAFRATDEQGQLFADDAEFIAREVPLGPAHVMRTTSGLDENDPTDAAVIEQLQRPRAGAAIC